MTRSAPDSCPGVLRLHEAADGPLARIRLPGGAITPDQLRALASAAADLGNGSIELTSRGNVQLRQMHDAAALATRLEQADLLPAPTHERVRNIVASPLSGRLGGRRDVHPLVAELDAGLRGTPELAGLPGRVLFTLDDGRGDISGLGGDIGVHATGEDEFALVLAGLDSGVRIGADRAVPTMLAAAHGFQRIRGEQWRLREVADGPARVLAELALEPSAGPVEFAARHEVPIGWLTQADDGVALGAGVPLGALPARTAEFVAAVEHPILVTPWRSLVLADLDEWTAEQVVRVLAPMGLIFDATSPWLTVTACAGRPGCAKARTDVRADVAAAVASGRVLTLDAATPEVTGAAADDVVVAGRQHWSGCERRCGRPVGAVTDVVAEPDGYRVTGPPRP
ncbi:precorrin-3B synthase [Nocardia veterana]|uniref:Precorrin-3B synthase n=1 Tax=Nocardia veterana TaxID=132249 RepID=A0A7X6M0Q0_9NOCA|nr:precorrin-3B synthase [Nocardia veterana]NKY88091.1 precorrin-3B synthase [Nocardia veterana]